MNVDDRIRSDADTRLDSAGTLPTESQPIDLDPLHGVVQALASIFLAAPLIVTGVPAMHLIWVLWNSRFHEFAKVEIILVAVCGFVGGMIVIASTIFGLIFSISAISAARQQNRPPALGVAGALLNGLCLLLWLFIGILWAFAVGSRI